MSVRFSVGALKKISSCSVVRKIDFTHLRYGVKSMSYMTTASSSDASSHTSRPDKVAVERGKKISQAMKSYLERSKAHVTFMSEEIAEYEIGKRHLAAIMGEDPETFSQEDIDRAIQYLLPSGIFDKKARPMLRHPTEVIPARKAAQFDVDGRPFHSMFYTGKPNFFQLMNDGGLKVEKLQQYEDTQISLGLRPSKSFQLPLAGSQWISLNELEKIVQEKVSEGEYLRFIKLMERLVSQPYAAKEADFVTQFRKNLSTQSVLEEVPALQYDDTGKAYIDATGTRKTADANVRVWVKGSGQFLINGRTLFEYFPRMCDREQILFPIQFCGVTDSIDVVATIEGAIQGPGNMVHSAQAGALRLGIARALQGMVSKEITEKMRLAGLLTRDPRVRERKKPGQSGARRKFTWKKR